MRQPDEFRVVPDRIEPGVGVSARETEISAGHGASKRVERPPQFAHMGELAELAAQR
jgi:hypothetical protein